MMNTFNQYMRTFSRRVRSATISVAIPTIWAAIGAHPGLAEPSAQRMFASAVEASQGLFQAVQDNNVQAITNVLGGPTDLTSCGDPAQDKADRKLFVQKYREMHRLGPEVDGTVTLYIGAENWPFPVPLIEKNGTWHFDPNAGRKEVLFRRIGENELTAIAICHEFVTAEKQYLERPNSVNPTDGLPTGLMAQAAGQSASDDRVLLHGYYFHALATHARKVTGAAAEGNQKNGFVLIAYPADYGSSGVMTFIITENDLIYERDLGDNTSALAGEMKSPHKDAMWHAAE